MNRKLFYEAVIILLFLAIGIQPVLATKFIRVDSTGGDATSIGTWDWETKTCTLTMDVSETIQIMSSGITLDGAGQYEVSGTGSGVLIISTQTVALTNITVRNLNITGCSNGIHISKDDNAVGPSSSITLEKNNISNTGTGITIEKGSQDITLLNNTVFNNTGYGIWITTSSNGNAVEGNTVSGNQHGIVISGTSDNNLTNNIIVSAGTYANGIWLKGNCERNTLTGNILTGNSWIGIWLEGLAADGCQLNTLKENEVSGYSTGIDIRVNSNGNILTDNTISNNFNIGIRLAGSSSNQIYHNNFIDNPTQAVDVSGGNDFDLGDPASGGNYWSDYPGSDTNGDGIGDTYIPHLGLDNYPFMVENGWTPEGQIQQLIAEVEVLNTKEGIINSLDAKLQNALDALDAANAGLRQDAINKMEAFVNAVEAQSGNQISVEDANMLIAKANGIIAILGAY